MRSFMQRAVTGLIFVSGLATCGYAAPSRTAAAQPLGSWQTQVKNFLPLLGHRNWILVVDSAYPLEISPGITTLETHEDLPEVLGTVLGDLHHSIHVNAIAYTDAELPYVPEDEAHGVTQYRNRLKTILAGRPVQSLPHEELLAKASEAGKQYRILVLKTTEALPYTSVFLQLDCKYWSAADEQHLRQAMSRAGHP